ncbi:MAG: DUF4270 family protein [Chitinophagaceae bacterium]|nr:MAG: DUF4270 family protein [Chitinophagaceae bacterium]
MKNYKRLLLGTAMVLTFGIGIESCRKINEATVLGNGLVPAVDNINTFADTLTVNIEDQDLWSDSTQIGPNDQIPLGTILNEPEFGKSKADIYFSLAPGNFDNYPFYHKDSLIVGSSGLRYDSADLFLGYTSIYGDSMTNQVAHVHDIAQNAGFNYNNSYTTKAPEFNVNAELGNATYKPGRLQDSIRLIRKRDTTYYKNTLRIPLGTASSFINRLIDADPDQVYSDYASFYRQFPGIAIRSDNNTGKAFTYFNLIDSTRTRLRIYFRVKRNGVIDTTSVDFYHGLASVGFANNNGVLTPNGTQASVIRRIVGGTGGNWLAYLNNSLQDKVYVQSDPGSQTILSIPGLTNYSNRVIHRAELIATRLHTTDEDVFPAPPYLYLTRTTNGRDTLTLADDSLSVNPSTGAVNAGLFGGDLKSDDTYRFNISRHVQDIVAGRTVNTKLKLFAPYRYTVRDNRVAGTKYRTFNVIPRVGAGRVVLAGPTNPNPQVQMRVRVVWSRI